MNNNITKQDFRDILLIKGTEYMLKTYKIDISLLTYVEDIIDWNMTSAMANLGESEISLFSDRINFNYLNLKSYFNLSEKWLLDNSDLVDFEKLSYREDLSLDFIRKFLDRFHWNILCLNRIFSESEIEEFIDYVNWSSLTITHRFTHDFLLKHKDKIDIKYLNLQDVDKQSDDFRDKWNEYNANVERDLVAKIDYYNKANSFQVSMTKEQRDTIQKIINEHPIISREIKFNKITNDIDKYDFREVVIGGFSDKPADLDKDNRKSKLSKLNGKSDV